MRKKVSVFLITFVFLASCSSLTKNNASPQNLPTPSATVFPTRTLLAQVTFSPSPTKTDEMAQTQLPTLGSQDPSALITELMENNGNCKLPCWWGVVPGQTLWQYVEKSLSPIANAIYKSTSENSDSEYIEMFFPAPYPFTGEFRQVYLVKKDIVQRIEILPQKFSKYSVPKGLLQELGDPEIVFLAGSVDQPQSFQLILYYPGQGVFALYSSETYPFQQKEVLDVCFTETEIVYVNMFLWDTSDSFSETLDYIFRQYERPFYEIEFVTDLTIREFSEIFISSDQLACLQTPSSVWRN